MKIDTQAEGWVVIEDAAPCKSLVSESSPSVSSPLGLSKSSPVSFSGVSNLLCHDDKSTIYAHATIIKYVTAFR